MKSINLSSIIGDEEERKIKIRKARGILRKISTVAREGLEIYSSMKSKDFVSVGLGALSATSVVLDNMIKEPGDPESMLRELGAKQICPSVEGFARNFLRQMNIPMRHFWEDEGDKDTEGGHIEEYDLVNSKAYFIVSGRSRDYTEGVYVLDELQFFSDISVCIEKHLGRFILLESVMKVKEWGRTMSISPITISKDVYINNADLNENDMAECVKKFFAKGLNRSMLFYGPPGSGKTTLALRITNILGGRILVLDGRSLCDKSSANMFDVISMVDPSVILFDDFDRISGVSRLLGDVERLNGRVDARNRLLVATVNDLSKIPTSMRRPGRFDQSIEFRAPGDDGRMEVLLGYAEQFNTGFTKEQLEPLKVETENMTQAYLKEIILRASVIGIDKIIEHIAHMKKVALFGDNSKDNGDDE